MVFYRKYRPQTLDEIIGQTLAKQALMSAVSSGKLAHAYLFCGPRGTGKTSTARILAKIVNCEKQSLDTSEVLSKDQGLKANSFPCNKCSSCLSITDGSNLDVVEMDAASNRGIEDIRALRDNIRLSPTAAKKKVYIIDEVHMLSNDAFNALLKTLEEPPTHVLFILATTELQKIPQTILSRVTKLDFKAASAEELVEALERVVKAEKIEVEREALLQIAKKAQGSFRDGIKLLDLISGLEEINEKTIEGFLCGSTTENVCSILESLSKKDVTQALGKLTKEIESGVGVKELATSILDILRQLLLIKHGLGAKVVALEMGEDKFKVLSELGAKFDNSRLSRVINCFQKSLEQGRYTSIPSLPLELAVVESCEEEVKNAECRMQNAEFKEKVSESASSASENKQKESSVEIDLCLNKEGEEKSSPILNSELEIPNSSSDIAKLQERWGYILETIRGYNFSLEALLRSSKVAQCGGSSVVLEVPYSFHQRIIEAPKSRDLLESVFADVLQRSVAVSTVLGKKAVNREELANVEVAADDEIVRLAAEIFNSEPVN